jgi:hypothetical protein
MYPSLQTNSGWLLTGFSYIAHSCFSLIFPMHLVLLRIATDKPMSYYISLMLHTFRINFPITTNLNVSTFLLSHSLLPLTLSSDFTLCLPHAKDSDDDPAHGRHRAPRFAMVHCCLSRPVYQRRNRHMEHECTLGLYPLCCLVTH